jgi:hypothetical protein
MSQHGTIAFLVTVFSLLALSSCREIPTTAKIESGPSFSLRGSGRLASFRIYGPQVGHKIATPFDEKSLVWRVQPLEGYFKGAPVERLVVEYGNVPRGYSQTTRGSGAVPDLPTGQVYYFFAETTNAPPAEGFFYLDGIAPIEISVPGLCQSGFGGGVKALKCGTNEPYTEPMDLEQFVRRNRVQK